MISVSLSCFKRWGSDVNQVQSLLRTSNQLLKWQSDVSNTNLSADTWLIFLLMLCQSRLQPASLPVSFILSPERSLAGRHIISWIYVKWLTYHSTVWLTKLFGCLVFKERCTVAWSWIVFKNTTKYVISPEMLILLQITLSAECKWVWYILPGCLNLII